MSKLQHAHLKDAEPSINVERELFVNPIPRFVVFRGETHDMEGVKSIDNCVPNSTCSTS